MLTRYLLAIAWTLALTASFAGWGAAVGRALLGRREGDFGERVAWGIALTVGLGGLANLLRMISPGGLIGYAAAGLGLFVVDLAHGPRPGWPALPGGRGGRWAMALVVGAAACRVAASAHAATFDPLDDETAYLAFPVQMLQTGALTRDPFCTRRIESALGGMSLLQAFARAAFAEEGVKLVDGGVGFLAVLAGVVGLSRSRGLSGWAMLPALILVEFDRPPAHNITAVMIPIALLLALHRALGRDGPTAGRAAMLGLLGAALVALKSSLLPIAVFVVAIDLLPRIGQRGAWTTLAIEAAVGLACLASWMVAMERSSGTYFYPLLGRGVHGSQYGTLLKPDAEFTAATLARNYGLGLVDPATTAHLLFVVGGLATLGRRGGRARPEDLALLLAPIPSLVLLLRMFDRMHAARYVYPIDSAAMIVALTVMLGRSGKGRRGPAIALGCMAFFLGARWTEARVSAQFGLNNIRAGFEGRSYVDPDVRAAYAAMQAAVPPGEPILARLGRSYLVDFRRNPVSLVDWPGGASPAPGMPFFRGPEALADYLMARGIRHVAYSYGDQANLPKRVLEPGLPTWERTLAEHAFDLHDNLTALMQTRRHAFDDGALVVIDLSTPGRPR